MDEDLEDLKNLQNIIQKNKNESNSGGNHPNSSSGIHNQIHKTLHNNNDNNNKINGNSGGVDTPLNSYESQVPDYDDEDEDELELDIDEDGMEYEEEEVEISTTNSNVNSLNTSSPILISIPVDLEEDNDEEYNRMIKRIKHGEDSLSNITIDNNNNFYNENMEIMNNSNNNNNLEIDESIIGLDMFSGINVEEALSLNKEYQSLLKSYISQIEEAQKKNFKYQREIKEQMNVTCLNSKLKVSNEKKSGNAYFSFEVIFDGVTQTYYPKDNLDTEHIRNVYNNMPLYFKCRRWSKQDIQQLYKGVQDRNHQKKLFQISESNYTIPEYNRAMKQLQNMTKKELESIPLTLDDFAMICMENFQARTPDELLLRWKNKEHPDINNSKFTKQEDKQLLELCIKYEYRQWQQIALELGTNRTPLACLRRYQRSLNSNLMKREWTKEEDLILKNAYLMHGDRNWQTIAEYLPSRTGQQCLHRWQKTLNPTIKRGKWSSAEDELLRNAVIMYGYGNWVLIKKHVAGRTDMQCRERWCNVIDPQLNKQPFSKEEDEKLKQLIEDVGVGKWSTIASALGTRTDNQCWRRWKQIHANSTDLQKYQNRVVTKKKVVVSNFVGREKERSNLSIEDIVEVHSKSKQQTQLPLPNNNSNEDNNDDNDDFDSILTSLSSSTPPNNNNNNNSPITSVTTPPNNNNNNNNNNNSYITPTFGPSGLGYLPGDPNIDFEDIEDDNYDEDLLE